MKTGNFCPKSIACTAECNLISKISFTKLIKFAYTPEVPWTKWNKIEENNQKKKS